MLRSIIGHHVSRGKAALAQEILTTELEALAESIRQTGQVPKEFDGRLLAEGGRSLKARLDPAQKKAVRNAFLGAIERRLAEAQQASGFPRPNPKAVRAKLLDRTCCVERSDRLKPVDSTARLKVAAP